MSIAQSQTESPEATQIRVVLDGNSEGFCELVRPYQRGLYLKALSIVRVEADAEEVVQNAVLKGFTKLRQFRHDSRFRTWLMSITVNEARMWLRRNCKFEHQSFDYEDGEGQQLVMEIADPQEGPFQVLERKQIRSAIFKALTLLSSRDSEVFILRDLQLRSIVETARILGISETNVKSRLRRGRLRMRQALAHLRGARSSERNDGSNNASRRLRNPDPVCSWPRSFANNMGSIQ
jgi:RNA polymerase sigma-70 factor (ECF subfamily)